jgi:hypothetical protein
MTQKYKTKWKAMPEEQNKQKTDSRLSDLEDKILIKGKTEELLVKQLKTCERNIQELSYSIKNQT